MGPKEFWPKLQINKKDIESCVESEAKCIYQLACFVKSSPLIDLNNYSNFDKVVRVTSWVRRFVNNCRSSANKLVGPLTTKELNDSEIYWIRVVQQDHFAEEISLLKNGKSIKNTSTLFQLNPKLDNNDLLCVSSRLQYANCCDTSRKNPWIIPPKTKLAELLIIKCHKKVFHSGLSSTFTELRERFFIIRGRQLVKSIIRSCLICKRFSVKPASQVEAPLPADRVQSAPPFEVTGLDFAGPLYVKESNAKCYILVCTCATTRAIHLEIVSSLATEHFLLAFRRFISRRGVPSVVYSDNAQTFKKANSELRALWHTISHPSVREFYGQKGINWKYIVERAPWWGGFWERMVQSVKGPLRKTLGRASLTSEELETTLIEIEAMLNSRPITYVYNDPNDPEPLTPSHFLLGKRLISLPVSNLSYNFVSNRKDLIKRVRYRRKLLEYYWNRWRREYLLALRAVPAGKIANNLEVGDVVLLGDVKLPRNMWTLGIITNTFPGRDKRVRACEVRLGSGQSIRRPIQLLYPLEIT